MLTRPESAPANHPSSCVFRVWANSPQYACSTSKMYIQHRSVTVPMKPFKPRHQVKSRMIPIRVSPEDSIFLEAEPKRFGLPISRLMRDGARLYVRWIERKDEPQ